MQQRWEEHPPLDLERLPRRRQARFTRYPVDAAFKKTTDLVFTRYPYVLNQLPNKTYEAIDLMTWLAARPESEVGKGDYLTIANGRDEQLYYTRAELEELKPVIVVGLDDEPNPYKLFGYYRLKHAYSWKKGEEPMPIMIRPLGAFLHFQKVRCRRGLVNKHVCAVRIDDEELPLVGHRSARAGRRPLADTQAGDDWRSGLPQVP